ncbi:hypothetical protein [Paracoccus litorisediminis]|uniref:Uncharacterized protein n=1 Tax=Paracoccus litorisediminis TaxID=2006130 RepID=A0A844HQ58_9RHOB|nr:hypothetical protein [Paracoccus litorisediminis]MTH61198.1 hypothetical protein [Paracoccus litorisediminis]
MRIYPEGAAILLSLDVAGIDLAGGSATLRDEHGDVLADLGPVTGANGQEKIEVLVPAEHNVFLPSDDEVGVRFLRISFASGVRTDLPFGIERDAPLREMENSFMTLPRAVVEAARMVGLEDFNAEEDEGRLKAALIEAYRRITQLRLTYETTGARPRWESLDARIWEDFTPDAFTILPSRLQRALRRAQLTEASEILRGNAYASKIAAGIQSETIGEASITFRADASISSGTHGVSTYTMAVLSEFHDTTIRIGRA